MCQNIPFKKQDKVSRHHITVCAIGMVHSHCGDATLHLTRADFEELIRIGNQILSSLAEEQQPMH